MARKHPSSQPAEHQTHRPGSEAAMRQQPQSDDPDRPGCGRLEGKVAVITGGDSGIGRATAIAFAKESANVAIIYLSEDQDATETSRRIKELGSECLLLRGDLGDPEFSPIIVDKVISVFGKIDIVVNNAAEQHPQKKLEDITEEQLERTFRTNIFAMFYLCQAVMPHLKAGASIINTTSVTAYKGNPMLLDYSATKGAIVAFTRSLALSLADKNIRVNSVAPGPIWTPLIPSTFPSSDVKTFGKDVPLGRAGQPEEVAPAFVYLASDDSSYVTGQTIHVNGGSIINS